MQNNSWWSRWIQQGVALKGEHAAGEEEYAAYGDEDASLKEERCLLRKLLPPRKQNQTSRKEATTWALGAATKEANAVPKKVTGTNGLKR
jgi:hypothetical protein